MKLNEINKMADEIVKGTQNRRSSGHRWVDRLCWLLKHGEISQRAVWLIYFAARQRLTVGKVRREENNEVPEKNGD